MKIIKTRYVWAYAGLGTNWGFWRGLRFGFIICPRPHDKANPGATIPGLLRFDAQIDGRGFRLNPMA